MIMERRRYTEAANAAMFSEGLRLFAASQPLVPVDTGRLRASGAVVPVGRVFNFSVIVGYATHYAVSVHERVEVPHVVGQAKFLEVPMRDAIPGMLSRVAADTAQFARERRTQRPRAVRGQRARRGRRGRDNRGRFA